MKKRSFNAAMISFIIFAYLCLSLIDAHAVNVALDWNTFMGSSSPVDEDIVYAIALDASGNLYVTGQTGNSTWGNPINPPAGDTDGFVAKFDSSGNMLWNTFIGSNTDDANGGKGIALDASGNVYVMGYSGATWGSPINAYTGSGDVFIAKLNSGGNLLWNTFIGSTGGDYGTGIAVDTSGNLYVTGSSMRWGNPINAHAGGAGDVFVAKLNSSGNRLWHTFMGSDSQDAGGDIALDALGNVYVVGESNKTWGNPVNAFAGGFDVFVAKLDSNGNRHWHTFMGSSDADYGYFSRMSLDTSGNVYVTGYSTATWGIPIDPFMSTEYSNGFVAKLDSSGNRLWNTFIGITSRTTGIKIDTSGNVYVTGLSGPFGSPINAYAGGSGDILVAKFNSSGNRLWHTFLGGAGIDDALDMALDASGNVYLGGYSNATWGNPINPFAGYYDGFAAKLNIIKPIPDTGQTQSYTNTFGEDSDYSCNPRSYTDLGNGIVRDNVTGLEWQQGNAPGTYTRQEAMDYCVNLVLGGYDDWRLPTIKELSTLIDYNRYNLPIDTTFFPDTGVIDYWSSTPFAYDPNYSWSVKFDYGSIMQSMYYSGDLKVCAVRGQLNDNNFLDNGNGTISDQNTGLMWQKIPDSREFSWNEALFYCEGLILNNDGQWTIDSPNASGAKYSDWRLPNINELQSIVDYSRFFPAINTTYFATAGVDDRVWSSTHQSTGDGAWYINFGGHGAKSSNGSVDGTYLLWAATIRAVRGGQCSGSSGSVITQTIDSSGGSLSSNEGCAITVPAGAVGDGTTFSITPVTSDIGQTITISGGQSVNVLNHFYLDTSAANDTFNIPVTIDLTWPENAIIDLSKLVVIKDGVVITTPCSTNPCVPQTGNCTSCICNSGTRTFTVAVTGFSEFIIGDIAEATIIKLSSFTASPKSDKVILQWTTESEIDNAGFNIYRAESENGDYKKLNDGLISAKGSASQGASYEFIDNTVKNRKTYWYKLEDIDLSGKSTFHGPVSATPRLIYVLKNRLKKGFKK